MPCLSSRNILPLSMPTKKSEKYTSLWKNYIKCHQYLVIEPRTKWSHLFPFPTGLSTGTWQSSHHTFRVNFALLKLIFEDVFTLVKCYTFSKEVSSLPSIWGPEHTHVEETKTQFTIRSPGQWNLQPEQSFSGEPSSEELTSTWHLHLWEIIIFCFMSLRFCGCLLLTNHWLIHTLSLGIIKKALTFQ